MRSETISQSNQNTACPCSVSIINSNSKQVVIATSNPKLVQISQKHINSNEVLSLKNSRSSSLPLKIASSKRQANRSSFSEQKIAKSWNGNSSPLTFQQQQKHQQQQRLRNNQNTNSIKPHYITSGNNNLFLSYKYAQVSLSEHFLNLIEQQQKNELDFSQVLNEKSNFYDEASSSLASSYSSTIESCLSETCSRTENDPFIDKEEPTSEETTNDAVSDEWGKVILEIDTNRTENRVVPKSENQISEKDGADENGYKKL